MFSIRGPKFKYFALFMAAIALAAGVYVTFFESTNYVKTQATIVSIEEDPEWSASDDKSYIVMVDYVADGTRYTSRLDMYSATWKVGKAITVYYDPNDPTILHGGKGGGIYLMAVGVAIIAVVVVVGGKNKKDLAELEEMKAMRGSAGYAPSVKGEEREVYFLTDTGTPKYGHRIEDKDRRVLYEAKMTKFSIATAYHFDFIDHEHGKTTPHLVGHEESTENNSILFDNHYTFDFDGEDIWKHIKRNGVSVETERMEGTIFPRYRVSRDGKEIAVMETSSQYVHEEDAEQHSKLSKILNHMFYRIWTREEHLDVVFITAMAFARSGALNDEGGGVGKMARNSLKKRFGKE